MTNSKPVLQLKIRNAHDILRHQNLSFLPQSPDATSDTTLHAARPHDHDEMMPAGFRAAARWFVTNLIDVMTGQFTWQDTLSHRHTRTRRLSAEI